MGITLVMVVGYTWLMETNLVSGLLFSSEFRLNRTADAWIESRSGSSSPNLVSHEGQSAEEALPPEDGTPIVYGSRESLPVAVQEHLPEALRDGQLTVIKIDEIGLLNIGYLLHLFRTLPNGEGLHIVQKLVLLDHEEVRVQDFDALMYERALLPGGLFLFTTILIVYLFGRRLAKATTRLLQWSESLSIDALPDEPLELPFEEMQLIAEGTLASLQNEREAIETRHRFLRFASHELRTPLAIASANAELFARHGVDDDAKGALVRLEDALKNMRNLTHGLLWLGRDEAPLPDPEPVDLVSLVKDIIEENSTLAINNNVVVEVVEATNARTIQPRVLLVTLCSNLISNAIRHTRDGRVAIRLSRDTIDIENRGSQLGDEVGGHGHGLGLQLVAWVVERANWQWHEETGATFRRHRVHLTSEQTESVP
ncbi:MAG: HAMP domain-containing sensor histidine kinase [Pseudomonadota bacterium]